MKPKNFPQALKAARHLSASDIKLAPIIKEIGPMKVDLDPTESIFKSLATSIVYQQLHGKAAATILGRVKALFSKNPNTFFTPKQILACDEAKLRAAGLSQNKLKAMRDLAQKTLAKQIPERKISEKMTDQELIDAFSEVHGIGRWTAEMLLIFTLGRTNVMPIHDYGVRKGFMKVYKKKEMPTPLQLEKYSERWQPYRTIASWYMWQALTLEQFQDKPKKKKKL